jgi:hypothetical protein
VWRHAYRFDQALLLNEDAQPESDNSRVLVEAHCRLSQTLAVNRVIEPFRTADVPLNVLQARTLAEGLLTGLQVEQDKWS